MIARIWEGKTTLEHADAYQKTIEVRDIPNYRKTQGFVKLSFLIRKDNQYAYFKLITYWSDLKSITNFTGPNLEEAKCYDEDKPLLVDFPGSVMHYEVFAE